MSTTKNGDSMIPRHIRENEDYCHAVSFMQGLQAKEGVEYSWVFDYAKALWAERSGEFTSLDNKADAIIKYLGGGLGLFSIGVLAKVDVSNAYLVLWTMPTIVCAVASIFLAAWARKPNPAPTLPPVEAAISCAEEEKDDKKSRTIFLGQWNLICEGLRLANRDKAWLLELATLFYCLALALLALPMLAAAYFSYFPR
jgi:hypothetical protein